MRRYTFILAVIVASALGWTPVADAASRPAPGWESIELPAGEVEVPLEGVFAFETESVDGAGQLELAVAVLDEEGNQVPGVVDFVELVDDRSSDPWVGCPVESLYDSALVVWTTGEPLEAGAEYDVEIEATYEPDAGDPVQETTTMTEVASFTAIDVDSAVPESISVDDPAVSPETVGHDYACCDCDNCAAFCRSDAQQHCWYVSETERPIISAEVSHSGDQPGHQFATVIREADDVSDGTRWSGTDSAAFELSRSDGAATECFELALLHLASGEETVEETVCLDTESAIDSEEIALSPEWPDRCVGEEPDDYLSESEDRGGTGADSSGGCSAVGGSFGGGATLLIALLVLVGMRRE